MANDRWVGVSLSGRYTIESLLGQGGMSAVYKAIDPNLQRPVAIKLIHPHLTGNPEFVRRFESEATAIAKLRHPNIVQVFDLNHDGDLFYMVLEYVAGETLQSRIKRMNETGRQIPLPEALRYTIQICNAADYAHQRGMIHRDIKPANVMLDVNGNAILMDFGIARIVEGQQHTATGALLGTALYMSPEQIQGLHPDARSDIYSIGVTLFEVLGGRPPFEADSAMTLMMMHLNDPVPDLNALHPGIPEAVKALVYKALEKDRANRYQTCAEMAAALQSALDVLDGTKAAALPPAPPAGSRKTAPLETVIEPAPRSDSSHTIVEPAMPAPAPGKYAPTIIEPAAARGTLPARLMEAPPQPQVSHRKSIFLGIAAVVILALAGGGFAFWDKLQALVSPPPPAAVLPPETSTLTPAPTNTIPPTLTAAPTYTFLPEAMATMTNTPEPTATTEILPTATATTPPLPVLGGADKIAYLYGNNVWTVNVDGSSIEQLTTDGTPKKYLRWLPDGQSISYLMGKCIQTVDLKGTVKVIACFNSAEYLDTFEVSPDGNRVAISVDRQLFILPYDLEMLSQANSLPDLGGMGDCKEFAPYARHAVYTARWSKDGKLLAAVTMGVLSDGRRGDIVTMIAVDRCILNPGIQLQFPPPHFLFGEYQRNPTLVGLTWDGENVFVMNGITRNEGFGNLHIFNRKSYLAETNANPIEASCCYRDPMFSPDGTYLIFAYQDIRLGENSKTLLYYVPFGTLDISATLKPLPLQEYLDSHEAPSPALRPAMQP